MPKGKKNAYKCEACRCLTITIDIDEGVTPMYLACRCAPHKSCTAPSQSQVYPSYAQDLGHHWEWFKPDSETIQKMSDEMKDHLARGGLAIRRAPSCYCGDYKHQHEGGVGSCLVCASGVPPSGGCKQYEATATKDRR
jgi:hypothetical protein